MATNVPEPSFTDRGFIPATSEVILAGVLADIDQAFGGGVNLQLTSPQGQLATSEAACVSNVQTEFCDLTRQMDPAYNSGRYQDGIARIYFLTRFPSRPTSVTGRCTGLDGVVIPIGAIAQTQDGNLYTSTSAGVITGGFVNIEFACNTVGPIACPADTLTRVYQSIPGWDGVNNPSDGVLGRNTETRAEFEARRVASVALNSRGSLPSIQAAVLSIADVLDAYVAENDTNAPVTRGGVVLPANSLYVAVVGGNENDVARAIWTKKAPGCSYYAGNRTVVVEDTNEAYTPPYPSYSVKFEVPADLSVVFKIRLADNALVPADAAAQIKAAIIAAFAGSDGASRASIGSTIYASRYYAPIAALGSWVQIIDLLIGSANDDKAKFVGSLAGTALTVSSVTSGVIAVGQTIVDAAGDILANTVIISGAGSSWIVSRGQTVGSTTIQSILADANTVASNIDQVPTVSADNIAVVLV
jgi:hypothetical protein